MAEQQCDTLVVEERNIARSLNSHKHQWDVEPQHTRLSTVEVEVALDIATEVGHTQTHLF